MPAKKKVAPKKKVAAKKEKVQGTPLVMADPDAQAANA